MSLYMVTLYMCSKYTKTLTFENLGVGGVLQALSIMSFNFVYQKVLVWLTDLENWQVCSSCPPLPPHLSIRILAHHSYASACSATTTTTSSCSPPACLLSVCRMRALPPRLGHACMRNVDARGEKGDQTHPCV